MKYSFLSDVGKIRSTNEDAAFVSTNRFGDLIAIVADGMGGHNAGDIASKVAVSRIGKAWATIDDIETLKEAKKWLGNQYKIVNKSIFTYAHAEEEFNGMGTTLVSAIILDNKTVIANVGDSRAYVLFNGKLIQVTVDQTLVNELVDQGEISSVEAEFHPQKNVLMQAVGTSKVLKVDFFELDNYFDYLLLCSDGLTNMISDDEIKRIILDNSVDEAVRTLIETANSYGGHDNITVALIKVGD